MGTGNELFEKAHLSWQGKKLIIAGIDTKLSHLQAGHMGSKLTPEEMRRLMGLREYNTYGFHRIIFEMGWAGQGFLTARLMMIEAIRRNDRGSAGYGR